MANVTDRPVPPHYGWASVHANPGKPKAIVLPLLTLADLGRLLSPGLWQQTGDTARKVKLNERESP
jgi:hypothetical protein